MKEAREISVNLREVRDWVSSALPGIRVNGPIFGASYYRSAYELLDSETVLPELEEDFELFLRSFDDYESIGYLCLNNETVLFCDDINGSIFSVGNIGDILPSVREAYGDFCA